MPHLPPLLLTLLAAYAFLASTGNTGASDQPSRPAEIVESIDAVFTGSIQYRCLIQLPEGYGSSDHAWPLLLFLHGSGERGSDIELVKKWGPPRLIAEGIRAFPAVVVSPQCPADELEWEPAALVALIDRLIADYRIDEHRIYVTGLSMGGRGTWDLARHIPDRLAAIAPICGYGTPRWAPRLAKLPCWVFHGTDDEAVPFAESARLVNALNEVGAPVKFTAYPGAGHVDAWVKAYNESGLWQWLFAQKRD
ncbi:MAG: phospholipase [Verrucomicrobia bacterium]|nr:MAG: phospholipase [Verrucomicrobiota bacterium]